MFHIQIFSRAPIRPKKCVQTRLISRLIETTTFKLRWAPMNITYDKIGNTHLGIYLYGITHCMFTYIVHHTYTYGVTTVRIASNFSASK